MNLKSELTRMCETCRKWAELNGTKTWGECDVSGKNTRYDFACAAFSPRTRLTNAKKTKKVALVNSSRVSVPNAQDQARRL